MRLFSLTLGCLLLLPQCKAWDWWEENVHQKHVVKVVNAIDRAACALDKHAVAPTIKAVVKATDKGLCTFDKVLLTPLGNFIKEQLWDAVNSLAHFDDKQQGTHHVSYHARFLHRSRPSCVIAMTLYPSPGVRALVCSLAKGPWYPRHDTGLGCRRRQGRQRGE